MEERNLTAAEFDKEGEGVVLEVADEGDTSICINVKGLADDPKANQRAYRTLAKIVDIDTELVSALKLLDTSKQLEEIKNYNIPQAMKDILTKELETKSLINNMNKFRVLMLTPYVTAHDAALIFKLPTTALSINRDSKGNTLIQFDMNVSELNNI